MKVKLSFDGRNNSETWEVGKSDNVYSHKLFAPFDGIAEWVDEVEVINTHLEVSRGNNTAKIKFNSESELKLFHNRIALCRATGDFILNGELKENVSVYLTSF